MINTPTDHPQLMSTARMLLVMGVLIAIGTGLYFYLKTEPAPVNVHMPAKAAPQVAHETTVPVVVKAPLKVYRPEVKRKLKLPDPVQANPDQHVVASSRTVGDERPHTVTTVLDTATGEFNTLDRAEPLPWIAVSAKREIGVFFGTTIKNAEPALHIYGNQEILRIKALRIGVHANATFTSEDRNGFVGIGARW